MDGGIDGAIGYYQAFHDAVTDDSVAHITPAKAHHRELLSNVHESLLQMHKADLDAVNATARVAKMRPTGAVLSIWSQGVQGFLGGCHAPKYGTSPSSKDLPEEALQPFPGWPIFVANEAFGHMNCFAEGSLEMAEAAMGRMNITAAAWLPERHRLDPSEDSALVPTDPFLMPDRASFQTVHDEPLSSLV